MNCEIKEIKCVGFEIQVYDQYINILQFMWMQIKAQTH